MGWRETINVNIMDLEGGEALCASVVWEERTDGDPDIEHRKGVTQGGRRLDRRATGVWVGRRIRNDANEV